MKITTLILFACFMQLSAEVHSQISISERNVPITSVLAKIQQQSGYNLFYENTKINDVKVNVKLSNVTLKDALDQVLKDHNLTYAIVDKTIVVKLKTPSFLERVVDAFTPPVDVRGVVHDAEGNPLAGATVRVKGANRSVLTDGEGKFYLAGVDEKAVLVVSYVGYMEKEVGVKADLSIQLEMKTNDLDETIVVAYGTTTQRTNTGAVTVVKGEQIESLPVRSVDKALQGLVPGLQVTNGTGQPGGGVSNFVVRGITTGTEALSGSTVRNPLIIIDGVPINQNDFQISRPVDATSITNPMAQLNPSDIESISVLKDAAAIALYGSKASNGVILITTKKGRPGDTRFNFRHQSDYAFLPSFRVKNVTTEEYLDLVYESYKNRTPQIKEQAIRSDLFLKFPYIVSGIDTTFYPASDWTSALFESPAYTLTNELSISGGSNKDRFYLNAEITKQKGIVKSTGYDRKSFRFNFETALTHWMKIMSNSVLSYNLQDFSNPAENVVSYSQGPVMSPLNPIRNLDGDFIFNYLWGSTTAAQSLNNPVATAEFNENSTTAYRGLTNLKTEITFLKHLKLSSLLGTDFMLAEIKEKIDSRFRISSGGTESGKIANKDKRSGILINTNVLQYGKIFDEAHNLNVLLGQETQLLSDKTLAGDVIGAPGTPPYYDDMSSPGYELNGVSGNTFKQVLASYFGQSTYGYANKYFLSSSVRRDGSSKFGANQKWGTYWSVGTGWVISQESFFKRHTSSWLDYLKIRGSIGAAGSSGAIDPKTRYELLKSAIYQSGSAVIANNSPGNPYIKWEKTFTWDAGFEAILAHERLRLTADLYNKKTSNLIYTTILPLVTGYTDVQDNIGNMENSGIELSISADVLKIENIRWNINANWATNKNILIKANVPLTAISSGNLANEEGRNFNSFYLREWAGVNPIDGKPQWVDLMGKPTSTYNNAKQNFVGKPQPDAFGSITSTLIYGNLTLSAQFYYQYGAMVYDSNKAGVSLTDGVFPYVNLPQEALDRWTKPGDIAANPRRLLNNTDGGNRASTRYLYNGDYIRCQYAQLSYTLPKNLLRTLHLDMLKVFIQGTNLALWTRQRDLDPDNTKVTGNNGGAYPNAKNYSIGANLTF